MGRRSACCGLVVGMPCTAQVHRLRDSDPELIVLCAQQMMLGLCTAKQFFTAVACHVLVLYFDVSLLFRMDFSALDA